MNLVVFIDVAYIEGIVFRFDALGRKLLSYRLGSILKAMEYTSRKLVFFEIYH